MTVGKVKCYLQFDAIFFNTFSKVTNSMPDNSDILHLHTYVQFCIEMANT